MHAKKGNNGSFRKTGELCQWFSVLSGLKWMVRNKDNRRILLYFPPQILAL